MLGDTVILLSMFISSGDVRPTFAFCCCILVCNNIYYLIPWRCVGRLGGVGRWAGSPFRFVYGGCQASIVFVWPPCTTLKRPENVGAGFAGRGGRGGGARIGH